MLLVIIGVYLFAATRTSLWDRDEPRFSRAAYEMVESGNYLYPTFNGELRPDKPIMIYWLMSVPVRVFSFMGPNALPVRFVAAFGTAFSCLFTFLIARRLYSDRTALWSVGILASTLLIFMIGTAATADSILLPAMMGAIWLFYRALDRGYVSILDTLGLGAALGFALLAKGPVGLLPVLVILCTLLLRKLSNARCIPMMRHLRAQQIGRNPLPGKHSRKCWQYMQVAVLPFRLILRKPTAHGTRFWPIFGPTLIAVLIGAGLFLAWAIPANNATDGEFLRLGIGKHVVDRSTSAMESHGGNFFLYLPYYFIVPIFTFFPWSLHMPAAVSAAVGGRLGGRIARELVLAWILPIILLMTCVATKLPHYVILAFPALAILTAAFITGYRDDPLARWDRKLLRGGIWFHGVPNVIIAGALIVAPFILGSSLLGKVAGIVAGAILIVGGFLINRYQLREDTDRSTPIMIKTFLAAVVVILLFVMPAVDGTKMSYRIAKIVRSNTAPDTPVGYCDFREPSLNFYIGRHIDTVGKNGITPWFDSRDRAVLIVPQRIYDSLETRPVGVNELGRAEGFNYSNGKRDAILAIVKDANVLANSPTQDGP